MMRSENISMSILKTHWLQPKEPFVKRRQIFAIARLGLPGPTGAAVRSPWTVRRADLDPFDHVNNAANWAFLEEVLEPGASRVGRAEMEFVAPVMHGGDAELLAEHGDATAAWLGAGDTVLSAARWTPA